MAIDIVTTALVDLLKASLSEQAQVPPSNFNISASAPNSAVNPDLFLFLYLITPSAELRNADRVRPFPGLKDPPKLLGPAVPLDLHYLLTIGANAVNAQALGHLAEGIKAIEAASPLVIPELFQTVWLSLLPMTTDELSRIWGLFPNESGRTSIAFRASPVWIDPSEPAIVGPPVIDDEARSGRMMEPA
jgi:hypothetical protein